MKRHLFSVCMVALVFTGATCNSELKYKDDIGFLVSAQANSPEFPVYLNGSLCTDAEGFQGLCSKRIKSNEPLVVKFDAQEYAYKLNISCSANVKPVQPATVLPKQAYSFTMKPEDMMSARTFICIGDVAPQDRSPPISGKFQFTVVVVDAAYVARDKVYTTRKDGKNILVLGEHALSSKVFDQGKWTSYGKKTWVELKGDPGQAKAYSQSYLMRFAYLNLDSRDGPLR